MDFIKKLQEGLNTAVTAANGFSTEISALLSDGKALDDPAVVTLLEKRTAAQEDADNIRVQLQKEVATLETAKGDDQLLGEYEAAGFVAPSAVGTIQMERINGITNPGLRAYAMANPDLCSDEYRGALNAYVVRSYKTREPADMRAMLDEAGLQATVMETITDELGGFTVPPDVQDEILRNLATFTTMRRLASVRPTTSSLVEFLTVQRATGNDKSIYTGTFKGAMTSETPSATSGEADLKWQKQQIPVRMSRVIGWLTETEIADAFFDVNELLISEGAINLSILEDQQFIAGSGANGEVLGLLNHPQAASPTGEEIGTRNISGTTADTISNTTTTRGSEEDILQLIDDVPAQYRMGPKVAMIGRSTVRTSIRGLVTPAGNFVWRDELATRIEGSGAAGSVEGIPFHLNEFMEAEGTDANKVLVVGNFGFYRIVDRQRLTVRVSFDQKFDVEQVGLRLNSRFGGHVTNPEAFAIGIV